MTHRLIGLIVLLALSLFVVPRASASASYVIHRASSSGMGTVLPKVTGTMPLPASHVFTQMSVAHTEARHVMAGGLSSVLATGSRAKTQRVGRSRCFEPTSSSSPCWPSWSPRPPWLSLRGSGDRSPS